VGRCMTQELSRSNSLSNLAPSASFPAGIRLPERAVFPTSLPELADPFAQANDPTLSVLDRINGWLMAVNTVNADRPNRITLPTALPKPTESPFEPRWFDKGRGNVILGAAIPSGLKIESTVVLGTFCPLLPGDLLDLIRHRRDLSDIVKLERWMSSWFPRFDQIRETVGTPPPGAKRVVYVVEDSLWARRMSTFVDILPAEIAPLLKDLLSYRGAPAIERWLRDGGFKGTIEPVYTSNLERELETGLQAFETFTGIDCRGNRDHAKSQLRYTGIWPKILGISGTAVVLEPADHGFESSGFKSWALTAPYGGPGVNSELGVIHTLPAASATGPSRELPASAVPNYGNWETFICSPKETLWTALNFWPRATLSCEGAYPTATGQIQEAMRASLKKIFAP
jgi:hypothetical protein